MGSQKNRMVWPYFPRHLDRLLWLEPFSESYVNLDSPEFDRRVVSSEPLGMDTLGTLPF